nr:hypothetical protein GCM10010200_035370 [Actinomadura rugatobispora]
MHHPAVGDLDLAFDALALPNEPGLTLTAYTAEPDTRSEEGLRLLASWAATLAPPSGTEADTEGDRQAANQAEATTRQPNRAVPEPSPPGTIACP